MLPHCDAHTAFKSTLHNHHQATSRCKSTTVPELCVEGIQCNTRKSVRLAPFPPRSHTASQPLPSLSPLRRLVRECLATCRLQDAQRELERLNAAYATLKEDYEVEKTACRSATESLMAKEKECASLKKEKTVHHPAALLTTTFLLLTLLHTPDREPWLMPLPLPKSCAPLPTA